MALHQDTFNCRSRKHQKSKRADATSLLRRCLMAASMLAPIAIAPLPLSAQSENQPEITPAELMKRLQRLETMLELLLKKQAATDKRLDNQELALIEETARIVAVEKATVENAKSPQEKPGPDGEHSPEPPGEGGFIMGDTRLTIGGYLKADFNASRYSDGAPASNNPGRDFYIPATLPIGGPNARAEWATDFNVRESRFQFASLTDFDGDTLKTVLEFDFLITPIGDERISNSSVPRMRHAYINYKGWTIGQAWSTFMDLPALPENMDFVGPVEATNFNRQFLIRYKTGGLEIALEQPETTITDPITGARAIPGTDPLPDLISRYRLEENWGHVQFTGMLRYLTLDPNLTSVRSRNDNAIGAAASVSGKLNIGKDDFKFMATAGTGIGRYLGLNIVNGATVDATGNLDTIDTYSGYTAYRHFWTDKLRSSVTLSYMRANNPDYLLISTKEARSFHSNLVYSLRDDWTIGIEYAYARRELESGLRATLNRFQFSTKYKF